MQNHYNYHNVSCSKHIHVHKKQSLNYFYAIYRHYYHNITSQLK